MSSENCYIFNINNLLIIGSGGFGKIIFDISNNTIYKFIYNITKCNIGFSEFTILKKCYEQLEFLKTHISNKYVDNIFIPKTYKFIACPINIFDNIFSCALHMDYISGIPIEYINDPELSILPLPLKKILILPLHTSKNINIISLQNDNEPYSLNNPIRYYMMSVLNISKLPFISNPSDFISSHYVFLGIIFAICTFQLKINMIDLEILLGYNNNKLTYNLLDFGLVSDIQHHITNFIFNNDVQSLVDQFVDLGGPWFAKSVFPFPDDINYIHFIKSFKYMSIKILSLTINNIDFSPKLDILIKHLESNL